MAISVLGQLFFGTVITLTAKILFDTPAPGLGGVVHEFEKPWLQTTLMFVSMLGCLPLYLWLKRRQRRREAEEGEGQPLLATAKSSSSEESEVEGEVELPAFRSTIPIMWPALLDMAATGLLMTGLVFTTVSVCQMLRGAELVGCMLLSVYVLRRKLHRTNYLGALLCVVGITLVGLATAWSSPNHSKRHSKGKEILGFFLILVAQLLQASQTVIEEFLLKDVNLDALIVVGYEGVYGTVVCLAVVLPLCQALPGSDMGSFENTVDSAAMLVHSVFLVVVQLSDLLSTLLYNYFGMVVTKDMSALHKTIFETLRTVFAWAIDLMLYYWFSDGHLGEKWTKSSPVQLFGFLLIVSGTFTYNWTSFFPSPDEGDSQHSEPSRSPPLHSGGLVLHGTATTTSACGV
eukprot:RCo046732